MESKAYFKVEKVVLPARLDSKLDVIAVWGKQVTLMWLGADDYEVVLQFNLEPIAGVNSHLNIESDDAVQIEADLMFDSFESEIDRSSIDAEVLDKLIAELERGEYSVQVVGRCNLALEFI